MEKVILEMINVAMTNAVVSDNVIQTMTDTLQ
jgi:hypothetical protein